ncbi:MAG: hypothetical protein AAGA83_00360 [Cyanobacteria bacterium P01_F01_bin.116]
MLNRDNVLGAATIIGDIGYDLSARWSQDDKAEVLREVAGSAIGGASGHFAGVRLKNSPLMRKKLGAWGEAIPVATNILGSILGSRIAENMSFGSSPQTQNHQ